MQNLTINNKTSSIGLVSGAFEIFDPEEMSEVVPESHLEHTQLMPGQFKGAWLQAALGDTLLATGAYNLPLLANGVFPKKKITIGFLLDSSGISNLNGKELLCNSLPVWAENTECHIRLASNPHWCVFQLTRDDLESLGVHVKKDVCQIYSLLPQAQTRIKATFIEAIELLMQLQYRRPEIIDSPAAYKAIQELLTTVISSELQALHTDSEHLESKSIFQRYDLVKKAESFIHSNEYEKIGIAQLCEHLRTTVRRLELAFNHIHGMSPKKFIMMQKFTAVRNELLNASPDKCSVSEVAMRYGFFHMGRFSITYKTIFGESPSTTLFSSCYRRLNYINTLLNSNNNNHNNLLD